MGKDKKDLDKNAFEVDPDTGVILRKADGMRVMALSSVAWVTLENELASTFVSGAAVILQRMGYSYGRYKAKLAVASGMTPDDFLDVVVQYSKEAGWGRLVLNSGDVKKGQAHIIVKDCYFCLHWKDSQVPVCHMLVGFIGGVADQMLGRVHRVIEMRCIAKGDNVCEVVMDRLEG